MQQAPRHFTLRRSKLLVSVLSLLTVCLAHGQGLPMSAPALLSNIKPAGDSCRRAEQTGKPIDVVQREILPPDLDCKISAQELLLWSKAGQTTIVDTRLATEYAQYRIDGSLNIPLTEVVRKNQFRNQNVTLIGTGKSEREMYIACAQLKSTGFKSVKVLHGGMLSWVSSEQPVVGRASTVNQLQRLEPAELLAEVQFDANMVVVSPDESDMLKQLNTAFSAPQDNPEGLMQLLDRHRRENKDHRLNAVIWVASEKTKPEIFSQLRAVAAPLPLLVYTGGYAAYQRFQIEQKAVWVAHARGPKQPTCGL